MNYGSDNIEYGVTLGNLSGFYDFMGDIPKTIAFAKEAISILELHKEEYGSYYTQYVFNLADAYSLIGDFKSAIKYCQKAIDYFNEKEIFDPSDPDFGHNLLIGLAEMLNGAGETEKSISILLSIYDNAMKSIYKSYYANTLAYCYYCNGKYTKVLDVYNNLISLNDEINHTEHNDNELNIDYTLQSKAYRKLGMYADAFSSIMNDIQYFEGDKFLEKHPSRFRSQVECALCYYYINDYVNAESNIINAAYAYMDYVLNNFNALDLRRQSLLWAKYSQLFENEIPAIIDGVKSKNLDILAYDSALFSKGLLLNSETQFRKTLSNSPQTYDVFEKWCVNQKRFDNILNNSIGNDINYYEMLDSLNELISKQTKILFDECPALINYNKNLLIRWKEIQNCLSDHEMAIEFFKGTIEYETKYYAALLRKDYKCPQVFVLSKEDDINKSCLKSPYSPKDLYGLIWEPLEAELKDITNIYFSPVGELNKIGLEQVFYDHFPSECAIKLYRLSSTREILTNNRCQDNLNTILYGGLDFDAELVDKTDNSESMKKNTLRAYGIDKYRYGIEYLLGTFEEVKEISSMINKLGPEIDCKCYIGAEGTEDSFKALSGNSPNILHLATHGYFYKNDLLDDKSHIPFVSNINHHLTIEDIAMLQSRLFFSGANKYLSGKEIHDNVEDGVLSAMELSTMDLGKTSLVVLSACNSGLGEVTGEGVFGLQRGFKLAGVKSLLMSLWDVDDEATKMLMVEFYRQLLSGKTKVESLRLAQDLVKNTKGYEDPKYWAAWILLDALD